MNTNDSIVLAALRDILDPADLPRLLWWVGTVRPAALVVIEDRGQELAAAMATGLNFEDQLASWLETIEIALDEAVARDADLGRRAVWTFWTLFTRRGEPESAVSRLLRETVGLPGDEEAGFGPSENPSPRSPTTTPGPCFTCGSLRWWRPEGSALLACAGCFPPPPEAEPIDVAASRPLDAAARIDGRSR